MQKKRSAVRFSASASAGAFPKPMSRLLQSSGFLAGLLVVSFLHSAFAAIPLAADIETPATGDHSLHILSPNLLEVFLVNTKQPDPGRVDSWDWVNGQGTFLPPDTSSVKVIANGQTNIVTGVAF